MGRRAGPSARPTVLRSRFSRGGGLVEHLGEGLGDIQRGEVTRESVDLLLPLGELPLLLRELAAWLAAGLAALGLHPVGLLDASDGLEGLLPGEADRALLLRGRPHRRSLRSHRSSGIESSAPRRSCLRSTRHRTPAWARTFSSLNLVNGYALRCGPHVTVPIIRSLWLVCRDQFPPPRRTYLRLRNPDAETERLTSRPGTRVDWNLRPTSRRPHAEVPFRQDAPLPTMSDGGPRFPFLNMAS